MQGAAHAHGRTAGRAIGGRIAQACSAGPQRIAVVAVVATVAAAVVAPGRAQVVAVSARTSHDTIVLCGVNEDWSWNRFDFGISLRDIQGIQRYTSRKFQEHTEYPIPMGGHARPARPSFILQGAPTPQG